MYKISSLVILFGSFLLILSIINIGTANQVNPTLVRAETISGIASIALITIGYPVSYTHLTLPTICSV